MGDVMPLILLVLGLGLGAFGAWTLAVRYGIWAALAIPAALAVLSWLRASAPVGHAEEVMGRGMEMLFVWVPLIAVTLVAAVLGALWRRRKG